METRAVGFGAGFGWFKHAFILGWRSPKAVWGGAACVLGVSILAMFGLVALMLGLGIAGAGVVMNSPWFSFGFMAPVLLLVAALMVGYLRLIEAAEGSRDPGVSEVFRGFTDRATLRVFAAMLVLVVLQDGLFAGALAIFAPDLWHWYLQTLQATPGATPGAVPPTISTGFVVAIAVMVVTSLFLYLVQAIAFGDIALRGHGVFAGLGAGFRGAARNLPSLLGLFLASLVVIVAAIVVLALAVLVLWLLYMVMGYWVAFVALPVYILFLAAAYALMFGVMYFAWRDICGAASPRTDAMVA
jgi:hypothetical protein